MGELGIKDLHNVLFELSWAEFQLRLFAYERQANNRRADLRMIGWASFLSSFHTDGKKMPKRITDYWKLATDEDKPKLSPELEQAYINAVKNTIK